MIRSSFAIIALALSSPCSLAATPEAAAPARAGLSQEEIFDAKKVWEIHLSFTAEQWKAMEPIEGPRPPRRENWVFLQGPEGGRNGIAAAFGWQFNQAQADLEFGPQRVAEVAVRVKGNGTFLTARDSLKRSLKIDFNHFVKDQKPAGLSQINLHTRSAIPAT